MIMLMALEGMWKASPAPYDKVELIDPMDPRGVRVQSTMEARHLVPGQRCKFRGFTYRVARCAP